MTDIEITALVAIVVALIAAVPATIAALRNGRKIDNLNVQLNGGLAKLIAAEIEAAFAKGHIDGVASERARSNATKGATTFDSNDNPTGASST